MEEMAKMSFMVMLAMTLYTEAMAMTNFEEAKERILISLAEVTERIRFMRMKKILSNLKRG